MNRALGIAIVLGLLTIGGPPFIATGVAGDAGSAGAPRASLEELVRELQLVPMSGQRAESFSLPSLDGKRIALADLRGRPAILYFFASW